MIFSISVDHLSALVRPNIVDQHQWSAKSQQNQANVMNRSLDCGVLLRNLTGFEIIVVMSLRNLLLDP